jgi:hypothetical protein
MKLKHCPKRPRSDGQKGSVKVMTLQQRFTMTEATPEAPLEALF